MGTMTDKPDLASSWLAGAEQAAHTPGPWAYRPNKHDDWGWVRSADGNTVAIARRPFDIHSNEAFSHRRNGTDPYEANARLIAAAPDMLAALIEARKQLEVYELARSGELYNDTQINAAIAKATVTAPAHRDEPPQDTTVIVPKSPASYEGER